MAVIRWEKTDAVIEQLALGATDRMLVEAARSADKRAAGLLSVLAKPGEPMDRSGRGRVVEVYPAAALRRWGYQSRRYKGRPNAATRRILVDRFLDATSSWLVISSEHRAACARS